MPRTTPHLAAFALLAGLALLSGCNSGSREAATSSTQAAPGVTAGTTTPPSAVVSATTTPSSAPTAAGVGLPLTVAGNTYYVATTGSDAFPGTQASPLRTVAAALNLAMPGDAVVLRAGRYTEAGLSTQRDGGGSDATRIVLASYPGETATIVGTTSSHALSIDHSWITVQGLEIDGDFSSRDGIRTTNASNLIIRACRILNAGARVNNGAGDGIDIEGGTDVLVEDCEIFDCLAGSFAVQADSHGIVAGNFQRVTIRRCRIYRCSGDSIQFDPDRDPWDQMLIEDCDLYTEALPAAKASWAAGQVPGENAVDTKASPGALSQSFVIRDCRIRGFNSGWINNMAALNIKNDVTGVIERCVISDNVIAFRMRAPATGVVIRNCLTYDNQIAMRYEDGIQNLQLIHCTLADSSNTTFQDGGGGGLGSGFSTLNTLFEGPVPSEASDPSNQSANATTFVDAAARDYRLQAQSSAVDAASPSQVSVDLENSPRPQVGADVGAYER